MKDRFALIVRGRKHEWVFNIWAEPKCVEDWRADGLTVDRVLNEFPQWVAILGLVKLWCFIEDLYYFRNPWKDGKREWR